MVNELRVCARYARVRIRRLLPATWENALPLLPGALVLKICDEQNASMIVFAPGVDDLSGGVTEKPRGPRGWGGIGAGAKPSEHILDSLTPIPTQSGVVRPCAERGLMMVFDQNMSALLDEVLDAHGGLERWRAARVIHARVRTGGLLIRTRVPGNRFADYRVTVHVHEARTVLDPFPSRGQRGVFEGGAARIESHDGQVISSRANARSAFFGRSGLRRNIRWDPLDSVYFAGYAMRNYLTAPYLLTREDINVSEEETWQQGGETWRRLNANFPPEIDTHSSRQTFYFDAGGQLRRHDYVAEVIGRWARAAQYCTDPVHAGGLVFPTRRCVYPIGPGNRPLPFPTLVSMRLTELRVETE